MKMNYQTPTIEVFRLVAGQDVLTNSPVYDYTDPDNEKDDTYEDNF